MKNQNTNLYDSIQQIFTSYLGQQKHRKTPERYAILEKVYSFPRHFDIKQLQEQMIRSKYRVSRATLYNTIDLLLACNLVIKHPFGGNSACFEKTYSNQHEHFINTRCGKMFEFTEPLLTKIRNKLEKQFDVDISHYSLTFYGKCKKCKKCNSIKKHYT